MVGKDLPGMCVCVWVGWWQKDETTENDATEEKKKKASQRILRQESETNKNKLMDKGATEL